MSTWLWIALPLLFVVGLFVGALKDTKRVEESVKRNRDKMKLQDWDEQERKEKERDNWGVPPASPGEPKDNQHTDDQTKH